MEIIVKYVYIYNVYVFYCWVDRMINISNNLCSRLLRGDYS